MFSASSRISARETRVRSLLAGRLNSINSRKVPRIRCNWPLTNANLLSVYGSLSRCWSICTIELIDVSDAGGKQSEGSHLLLMQHMRLRLLQLPRALGDAGF